MLRDSLDANIIVHGIINEPAFQRDKIWDFLTSSSIKHRVFDIAISEAVYALSTFYGQTRDEVANSLTLFFNQFDDRLEYNRTIIKMVVPFWAEHPSLSFNDCNLGFEAEINNVEPLITLDKKLARQHPSAKAL